MPLRFFSKSEAVLFSWDSLKRDPAFMLGFQFLMLSAILMVAGLVLLLPGNAPLIVRVAAAIALLEVLAMIDAGAVRVSLRICEGESPGYGDLISSREVFIRYMKGYALYWLIVILGLIFFVIPGIYLAVRHQFFGHLMIDRGMGPLDAMKGSAFLTRGVRTNLVLLRLTFLGILILGILSSGIGVLAAVPVCWISTAWVYRRLLLQAENEGARALPEPPYAFR